MAETVQYYLEQMVPELEDLERKGLFTKAEIKAIVRKRTNLEYALKRRPAQKVDFLKYIEYEMNLEQLRKKRKDRLAIRGKVTISDYAITRRLYHIFDRAVVKFKGDVPLWLQYIEFARSAEAGRLLGKIFGRAIQIHPAKPIFWILAAKWEFEVNANIFSARVLLQRSLRVNPSSIQLWHEYFKLELAYVEKIRARRKILGISSELSLEEENPDTGNILLIPDLGGEDEQLDDQKVDALKEDNSKLLKGEIVKTVYLNSIKAIPENLSFRQKFIEICRELSDTQMIQGTIYESIAEDFSNNAEARAYLAERHLSNVLDVNRPEFIVAVKDSVHEFQQSTEELENKEMWYLFTKFLRKYLFKVSEPNLHTYFHKLLSKSYNTASKSNLASEQMYIDWIDWIISDNGESKFEEVQEIIQKSTATYPQNSELWLKRINIAKSYEGQHQDKQLDEIYKIALKNNPSSLVIWNSYVSWIFATWKSGEIKDHELEKVIMASISRIASMPLSLQTSKGNSTEEVKNLVITQYLNWADETGGLEKARKVYKSLLNKILLSPAFYQTCIKIEQKYVDSSSISSDAKVHFEWLYGQVFQYGKASDELWLDYIKFILNNSDPDRVTHIYERALEAVSDPEQFKRSYRELRGGALN